MFRLFVILFLVLLSLNPLKAQECNASFYYEENPDHINTFEFINTSGSNINAEITYYWDMGDGSTYQSENVTHQFNTPDDFNVQLSMQVPICTGAIQAVAEGGQPPYTFSWSNGYTETSDSISIQDSLCPGEYQISITDALGESILTEIEMEDLTGENLQLALDYDNCLSAYPDSCIGRIAALANGGTPPYTYQWSNGSNESEITGLCPDDYGITVCDANDACISDFISLPVFDCEITDFTAASTEGTCDGYILFEVNGGTDPYTFSWSPAVSHTDGIYSSESDYTLCAGLHTISVTDNTGQGCADSINLNPLDFYFTVVDSPSNGLCNGIVSANPQYGTSPYTYAWSNGDTDTAAHGLCTGWQHCTVCDSEMRCKTDSIKLVNQPLSSTMNWRGPSGPSACDGYIYAYIDGGVPPYTFSWDPAQESLNGYNFSLLNDLCSGTYILTTCDSQGACIMDTINLNDKPFNVDITATNPVEGACNGKINVSATGASPPYNFLWSNGDECLYQTSCLITDLCAGMYYVTITDFENNVVHDSVELNALPTGPEITNVSISLPEPEDACNGSAIIEAVGQEPLTFSWSTDYWHESNISGIENQCSGTYYVTVCDVNNLCTQDSVQLFPLSAHIKSLQHPYNGECNGSIMIVPDGGYPPYQINWDTGITGNHAESLCPGQHIYTVQDNFGNTYQDTVELINQSISPLQTNASTVQNATIDDYCTNSFSLNLTTNWFTSIRGNVFIGSALLPHGVVVLFTPEEDGYTARYLTRVENGEYRFMGLNHSNYIAFAIPVFTTGLEYFPIYYPTYYGDIPNWEDAQSISLTDTAPRNIHLYNTDEIRHGNKTISGQVIYQQESAYEENIFLQEWYDLDPPGIPEAGLARHIPVILMTEDYHYLKQCLTDHQGRFEFKHLREGNYRLHFEKAGTNTQYGLHPTGDNTSSVLYILDGNVFRPLSTGTESEAGCNDLSLYPNPVSNTCRIQLPEPVTSELRITIYNETGMLVKQIIKQPADNILTLNAGDLKAGFYSIEIRDAANVFRKKFIKQ
jgi:hypothetical protein